MTAVEAVRAYKRLIEVERAFWCLKDVIDMRPKYHRTHKRVRGHIFVAAMVFGLRQALDRKLKEMGSQLSAEATLEALRTVSVVEVEVGKEVKRGVTAGSSRPRQVLNSLGIVSISVV